VKVNVCGMCYVVYRKVLVHFT